MSVKILVIVSSACGEGPNLGRCIPRKAHCFPGALASPRHFVKGCCPDGVGQAAPAIAACRSLDGFRLPDALERLRIEGGARDQARLPWCARQQNFQLVPYFLQLVAAGLAQPVLPSVNPLRFGARVQSIHRRQEACGDLPDATAKADYDAMRGSGGRAESARGVRSEASEDGGGVAALGRGRPGSRYNGRHFIRA